MNKTISLMFSKANTSLTSLGKALFYLYILLVIASGAGMTYGIGILIMKLAHIESALSTPWWEIIMLIISGWLIARIFIKESYNMVDLEKPKVISIKNKSHNDSSIEKSSRPASNSNVIAFVRKGEGNKNV